MPTWFASLKRLIGRSLSTPSAHADSLIELIDFLIDQLSMPERAPSIVTGARHFTRLPSKRQESELPSVYLTFEKYLTELDPHKKFTRDQLRSMIRSRFPDLLALPGFGLIFHPPVHQERLLCQLLLRTVLQRAYTILGDGSGHQPSDELETLSSASSTVVYLRRYAHDIYSRLESLLGAETAGTIFEQSYEQLQPSYVGLETFPIVIRLLPDHLLDERKIELLSRRQMQRVLLDKADELQQANEKLAQQNMQLEDAHRELRASKEDLERKVTERTLDLQQANEQIQQSLYEKEVLLKEIHHRVKNNLQIISSLLSLQLKKTDNREVAEQLAESGHRIHSMALIHERLYQSTDLASIDFGDYVRSLADELLAAYEALSGLTTIEVRIEAISLDIDTAVPCGLIINELVSNALKYAFTPDQTGLVTIELVRDQNEFRLVVSDDGAGFPADIDIRTAPSLGLRIVHSLVRQLRGTLNLTEGRGATIEIRFPIPPPISTHNASAN
jgi:two-component sensor histidine kinase